MSFSNGLFKKICGLKRFFVFYRKPEYLKRIQRRVDVRPEDIPAVETSDGERLCKNPLVSVLVATYNQEEFIRQALDSVLMQKTDFEYEVIVGDDCSSDSTGKICAEYQQFHPDVIRYITASQNVLKLGGNLARLNNRARGDFIAVLEGDDYWTDPEKLQKQVDVFRKYPEVTLCLAGREKLSLDGSVSYAHNEHFDKLLSESKDSEGTLFDVDDYFGHPLGGPIGLAMYRKSALDFNEVSMFYYRTSYTLYFLLLKRGKGFLLRKPMVMYRVNPNGVWSGKTPIEKAKFSYEYFSQLLLHMPESDSIKRTKRIMWRSFRRYLFPWRILYAIDRRLKAAISFRRFLRNADVRGHGLSGKGRTGISQNVCTGCAACAAICPVSAIKMLADSEGFLYPVIDNVKCLDCGLCKKVCPVMNICSKRKPLVVYAARALDMALRGESSSGAVFSILARGIIAQGGVVYGAAFEGNEWRVVHKSAESEEELSALRGSKYVQSDLGKTFNSVAANLKSGRKVLFTGTPCQVAGMRNYLRLKELYPSDNLLLVDVVCHAAPSPSAWKAYLGKRCHAPRVESISFRCKNRSWKKYSVHIGFDDGTEYLRDYQDDTFMRGFLAELFNRPSCHNCPFRELRSGSDMTLGDFWGIETIMPDMDDDRGTSLVLVNNDRNLSSFATGWDEDLEKRIADYDLACQKNPAIIRQKAPHQNRHAFFAKVGDRDFDQLVNRLLRIRVPMRTRVRSFLRRCLRKVGLIQ